MTLRELWMMAAGRRREARQQVFEQAVLVWSVNEVDPMPYIHRGELPMSPNRIELDQELQANVDAKMAEILSTGKLIV